MSEIVERLNRGEGCLEDGGQTCISMNAESGCLCAIAADTITRLTAEVTEYEAAFDAQWNADMAGVQMWREAHPGNDMVLPDRAIFTAWILAEIMRLRSLTVVQETLIREAEAENEKLRAALEGVLKAGIYNDACECMSCEMARAALAQGGE